MQWAAPIALDMPLPQGFIKNVNESTFLLAYALPNEMYQKGATPHRPWHRQQQLSDLCAEAGNKKIIFNS
jgi:hypothetical protein